MLRFIYGSDSKNDRADAAYLARVGKLDPALLKPVTHRSEATQADLALIRSRDALVQSRSHLVSHARAMVKVFGARLRRCSTDTQRQSHRRITRYEGASRQRGNCIQKSRYMLRRGGKLPARNLD